MKIEKHGIEFTCQGNPVFIPLSSIDRITVEPIEEYGYIPKETDSFWKRFWSSEDWYKTGEYRIYLRTIGGDYYTEKFNNKEEAEEEFFMMIQTLKGLKGE